MAEIQWNKLGAYLKETQILGSIQSTLYWDQNTGMPKKGASWRSEQLTYIAKVLHKRNSSEEFSNLINSAKSELLDIVNPLIKSDSLWKSHALYLLAEYFYSKNEKQKSKEFFNEIITLDNSNKDIKIEAQKRIKRDFSD